MSQAPLQLYISALIFSPKCSIVRKLFQNLIPAWVISNFNTERSWGPELYAIPTGYKGCGTAAGSPDGTTLACISSSEGITILETATAILTLQIEEPVEMFSVIFSSDGQEILYRISGDRVRRRSVATGEVLGEMTLNEALNSDNIATTCALLKNSEMDVDTLRSVLELSSLEEPHYMGTFTVSDIAIIGGRMFLYYMEYFRSYAITVWDLTTGATQYVVSFDTHNINRPSDFDYYRKDEGTKQEKWVIEPEPETVVFSTDGTGSIVVSSWPYNNNSLGIFDLDSESARPARIRTIKTRLGQTMSFVGNGLLVCQGNIDIDYNFVGAGAGKVVRVHDLAVRGEANERDVTLRIFDHAIEVGSTFMFGQNENLYQVGPGKRTAQLVREWPEGKSPSVRKAKPLRDGLIAMELFSVPAWDRIEIWQSKSMELVKVLEGVREYALSADGSLFSATFADAVCVFDTVAFNDTIIYQGSAEGSEFLHDGLLAIYTCGSEGKRVVVIDLAIQQRVFECSWPWSNRASGLVWRSAWMDFVRLAAAENPYSSNVFEAFGFAKYRVLENEDNKLAICDARSSKVLRIFDDGENAFRQISVERTAGKVSAIFTNRTDENIHSICLLDETTLDATASVFRVRTALPHHDFPISNDGVHVTGIYGRVPLPPADPGEYHPAHGLSQDTQTCIFEAHEWLSQGYGRLVWIPLAYRTLFCFVVYDAERNRGMAVRFIDSSVLFLLDIDLANTPLALGWKKDADEDSDDEAWLGRSPFLYNGSELDDWPPKSYCPSDDELENSEASARPDDNGAKSNDKDIQDSVEISATVCPLHTKDETSQ